MAARDAARIVSKCINFRNVLQQYSTYPVSPTSVAAPFAFLEDVPGFHLGRLSSPYTGRFAHVYKELVEEFETFLDDVQRVLVLSAPASHAHQLSPDPALVSALYATYALRPECLFVNLLSRLGAAIATIVDPATMAPVFQTVTFAMLPFELVEMVVAYATDRSVLQFSRVNRVVRAACVPRMSKTARFVMRFDRSLLAQPFPSRVDGIRTVGRLMTAARLACEESLHTFLEDDVRCRRVKWIAFDNEWERLCPADSLGAILPSPYMVYLFGPLYDEMASALVLTSPVHVRFTSLGVTLHLLVIISRHPSIRSLSLTYCFPAIYTPRPGRPATISLSNIVFLALGFGCRPRWDADPVWRLLAHFPCLRHLLLYACEPDDPIDWPWDRLDALPAICDVETLHLQGVDSDLFPLSYWLRATETVDPARFSSLKLHVAYGIDCDAFDDLIAGLRPYGPSMRILVLDGLHEVRPETLGRICTTMPHLEGLSVFKRHPYAMRTTLCRWECPVYEYAQSVVAASNLRHLEINMYWSPLTYTPKTLDTMLAAEQSSCVPATSYADVGLYQGAFDDRDDRMEDGRSIVIPFAALCQRLDSFVLRALEPLLGFAVSHRSDGSYDIRETRGVSAYDRWNPSPERSWGQMYQESYFPCTR